MKKTALILCASFLLITNLFSPLIALALGPAIIIIGDSRSTGGVGTHTNGSNYRDIYTGAGTYSACVPTVANNIAYFNASSNYAIGGQSTAGFRSRLNVTSFASSGGTASLYLGSGGSVSGTDNQLNISANALYSPLNNPSEIILFMGGTNDGSIGGTPTYKQSMINIAAMLDSWGTAGKKVLLSNELPRGMATAYGEAYTISGGGTYTTSHSSVYISDVHVNYVTAPGAINDGVQLTKVGSSPGAGQYSVASGVYTFSASDVDNTVAIDYTYTASGAPSTGHTALHNWLSSSASNFVDPASSVDYQIPGALYNRSWVIPVDTWSTIADPAYTATGYNLPNTLADGLHPSIHGCNLIAQAFATALSQILPPTDYAHLPTAQTQVLATGNASLTTFSGTYLNIPITTGTFVVKTGSVIATDDGNGNLVGTGVTSGTIDYTTGAYSITFTAAPGSGAAIYGTVDTSQMLASSFFFPEGFGSVTSISGCSGTCITSGNLTSSNGTGKPKSFSLSIDSSTSAELGNGDLKMDVQLSTTTSSGYPELAISVNGKTSTGAMTITLGQTAITALALNKRYRASGVVEITAGPNGHLYGIRSLTYSLTCTAPANSSFTPAGETATFTSVSGPAYVSSWALGGTGNPLTDSDISGGTLRYPVLTQQCDTSSMTGSPSGAVSFTIFAPANTPVSGTIHLSRFSLKEFTATDYSPSAPSSLAQYQSDGTTVIASGDTTSQTTAVFKFTMSSANASDSLIPQVEVQPIGTSFTNIASSTGNAVTYSGSPVTGTVTVTGLTPGSYHWQGGITNSVGTSTMVTMGGNPDFIVTDSTPPTVTAFTIPTTASTLTVDITTFTATDDVGVTSYKLTESAIPPLAGDPGWTGSAPTTYVFVTEGAKTLYAWAKDTVGNVSTSASDTVTITLPTYTIGGTTSGLTGTLVLQNNAGDNLSVTTGSFTFATAIGDSVAYAVTILTQPSGQTCVVSNGSGTVASANITSVSVTCTNNDSTAPVRSTGTPSSAQSAGTTQITLSLTTDESATCKYGTTASTAYASIATTFSTTGGTSHSATITGLSNGQSYNYYVRCVDGATNANTDDYTISFSVASPASSGSSSGGSRYFPPVQTEPVVPIPPLPVTIIEEHTVPRETPTVVKDNSKKSPSKSPNNSSDTKKEPSKTPTKEPPTLPTSRVEVVIVDTNKNPVEGATVTLHSTPRTTTTDKDGKAIFENVEPGPHKLVVNYQGQEGEQEINLDESIAEFQFKIQIEAKSPLVAKDTLVVLGILAVIIAFLAFLLLKKYKSQD